MGKIVDNEEAWIDMLPIAMTSADIKENEDGTFEINHRYANDRYYDVTGVSRADFKKIDNKLEKVVRYKDWQKAIKLIKQAYDMPGLGIRTTFGVCVSEKEIRYISSCIRIVQRTSGAKVLYAAHFFTEDFMHYAKNEISKLDLAGATEWEFIDAINKLPIGVAVYRGGKSWKMITNNGIFLSSLGYDMKKAVENEFLLIDLIDEESKPVLEEAMNNASQKGKPQHCEIRVLAFDGSYKWLRIDIALYYYKDAMPYYIVSEVDITENKKSEDEILILRRQYASLMELSSIQVFEYHPDDNLFYFPTIDPEDRKTISMKKTYTLTEIKMSIENKKRSYLVREFRSALLEETEGSFQAFFTVPEDGKTYVRLYEIYYKSVAARGGNVVGLIGQMVLMNEEEVE